MEKKQYDLCEAVLRRLDREGILDKIVLIGSWCVVFYEDYFKAADYLPSIRTRDIDILIPIPPEFDHKVDLFELLKDLGFVLDFKGSDGYIRFQHPELILEFIVPERGSGTNKPYSIPDLGINAQPLRFMDLLLKNTMSVNFHGLNVTVPHPANFAIHKLIISSRRRGEKNDQDRNQAVRIFEVLIDIGESQTIRTVFKAIPRTWQKAVRQLLKELKEDKILAILFE